MTEEDSTIDRIAVEGLFNPSEEELKFERVQVARGFVPDRWRELRRYEVQRLGAALSLILLEHAPSDAQLVERRDIIWRSLHNRLTPIPLPDGRGIYYSTHRNWIETLDPIVDIGATEDLIPAPDIRLPFHLRKREAIHKWLTDGVQQSLNEYGSLTQRRSVNIPPLTQEQFDATVEFVAASGIPIQEHEQKIR